ncbi:transposase [Corynebacterium freiburgense]|uniref:transposase n=1 Tax=Corynebacterium freiburgense TaxID=556548 RepID=UPI00054DF2A6|nr:transposase [Corynebacterium freiburgense]WJZ03145.1 Transposase [Corynebacterium freiburgense]
MPSRYPQQFRAHAVAMVNEEGRSRAETCRICGIAPATLRRWLAEATNTPDHSRVLSDRELFIQMAQEAVAGCVHFTERCEIVRQYEERYPVIWMCDQLQISRIAYTHWLEKQYPSKRKNHRDLIPPKTWVRLQKNTKIRKPRYSTQPATKLSKSLVSRPSPKCLTTALLNPQ